MIANRTIAVCLCAMGLLGVSGPCHAVSLEDEDTGWSLLLDNDVLALDSWTHVNDDRNYTMGLAGSLGGRRFARRWLGSPRAALDRTLGSHETHPGLTRHAIVFGVTAFTPDELERREPIPFDRPYASLTFLANQKLSVNADDDDRARRSMLVLGMLGLDIAKSVQRFLHNKVGLSSQDPLGWHNQISDGGEPTALYSAEQLRKLASSPGRFDLTGNLGYKFGYYTGLTAGFDFRLGRVTSAYYEHPPNPMGNFSQLRVTSLAGNDLYAFLSYQATLVGYNALLQGQVRHSRQTFSGSQIERWVHWAAVGVVWDTGLGRLTYSFNYRSPEYKGPQSREHYWGGIYLNFDGR